MILSDGLTVIFAAVGAVVFLFLMDHLYRLQEARAEVVQEELVQPQRVPLHEITEESDEPNVAA